MRDKWDLRRAQAPGALTCTPVDVGSSGTPRMTTELLPVNQKLNFTNPYPCAVPAYILPAYIPRTM